MTASAQLFIGGLRAATAVCSARKAGKSDTFYPRDPKSCFNFQGPLSGRQSCRMPACRRRPAHTGKRHFFGFFRQLVSVSYPKQSEAHQGFFVKKDCTFSAENPIRKNQKKLPRAPTKPFALPSLPLHLWEKLSQSQPWRGGGGGGGGGAANGRRLLHAALCILLAV